MRLRVGEAIVHLGPAADGGTNGPDGTGGTGDRTGDGTGPDRVEADPPGVGSPPTAQDPARRKTHFPPQKITAQDLRLFDASLR